MIDRFMRLYNISNYRYDVSKKTLFIYEAVSVKTFLYLKRRIKNIVIKETRGGCISDV